MPLVGALRSKQWCKLNAVKPFVFKGDHFDGLGLNAKLKFLELVGELVSINEVDRWSAVPRCLFDGGIALHETEESGDFVASLPKTRCK